MTKSLEQIQQENRKFILEAIGEYKNELKLLEQEHQIYHEIISKSFYSKPLTLSRVLLALKDKKIGFYDDSLGEIWQGSGSFYREDEVEYICDWDLTKETLEEQSEETQRGINSYLIINNLTNKN